MLSPWCSLEEKYTKLVEDGVTDKATSRNFKISHDFEEACVNSIKKVFRIRRHRIDHASTNKLKGREKRYGYGCASKAYQHFIESNSSILRLEPACGSYCWRLRRDAIRRCLINHVLGMFERRNNEFIGLY